MASSLHLTQLPLEVTQKIISHLSPFTDLIALSQTCRGLHRLCNDIFVLQESFLCHIDDPTSKHVPCKDALRKLLSTSLAFQEPAKAKAIVICLIAAVSQLPAILDELEDLLTPFESVPWDNSSPRPAPAPLLLNSIIGTLSTLTVLGYPTVNDFVTTALLTGLAGRLLDPKFWLRWHPNKLTRTTLTARMAFCLAIGSLQTRVLNNMSLLAYRTGSFFSGDNPEAGIFTSELSQSLEGNQTVALLVIAVMPWMLDDARARQGLPAPSAIPLLSSNNPDIVTPLPDGDIITDDLPSAVSTMTSTSPFHPAITPTTIHHPHLLTPFALSPSWPRWLRANLTSLLDSLSPSNRDNDNDNNNGCWILRFTNSLSQRERDPLGAEEDGITTTIRGIRLVASEDPDPDPEQPNAVCLATADDIETAAGPCALSGRVCRETARVRLVGTWRDTGAGAEGWLIEGAVTPLGIAGCWGLGRGRTQGLVWLFREGWVEGR